MSTNNGTDHAVAVASFNICTSPCKEWLGTLISLYNNAITIQAFKMWIKWN